MRQYCRYCSHLTTGNGNYCSKKQHCLSEAYCKAQNSCHDFEFNEIDAFDLEKRYKPRKEKADDGSQMRLF